jgi:hypothetical protein
MKWPIQAPKVGPRLRMDRRSLDIEVSLRRQLKLAEYHKRVVGQNFRNTEELKEYPKLAHPKTGNTEVDAAQ